MTKIGMAPLLALMRAGPAWAGCSKWRSNRRLAGTN
jgi:hypothetical protein